MTDDDKKIMKKFGVRVAAARKERSLTQEKLAEHTSMTARAIQEIEGGKQWPRPATLSKLAKALHTTISSLFDSIS